MSHPSDKRRQGMTRRRVLHFGLAAAAAAAVAPFPVRRAYPQSFNWQRFRGKEVYAIFFRNPWTDVIVPRIPDFEALTGIKVKYEVLPEIQARQKLTVEMAGGSSGLDVFMSSLHVEKRRFWNAGWYEPLNRYLEDKTLTAPDFDWGDMSRTAQAYVTQPDKSICGFPCYLATNLLCYRKDVFQEKGLQPPGTLEEVTTLAQKLHNPPSMYGFVARGLKNANAMPFSSVLFAMGGEYLTPDRKSALNGPAWVKAMDWYAGMLRRFAPPGVVNFNWYESTAAFMQGQVAMFLDGNDIATQFEDKEKSKVVGKVGYLRDAAGPAGRHAVMTSSAMAISARSQNKEAAYLFVQWTANKENCVRAFIAGSGGVRDSTWDQPEVKVKRKMPDDWYVAYRESVKVARQALPEIVDVTQYRDIIGIAIQKAIEGAKSEEVLAQAHKDFQEMLNSTEKRG